MATRSDAEIDWRLAPTAAEYVDEEHVAAEEELSSGLLSGVLRTPSASHS